MCLVLSWACVGVGMRVNEASGGLAVTKLNPMHDVTGATPNDPTVCEKAHHRKLGKSTGSTGKGFLKSRNRVLSLQPQRFLVVSLNLQGFYKGRPTGCPMAQEFLILGVAWLEAIQLVIAPVKMMILLVTICHYIYNIYTGFDWNIGSGLTAINGKLMVLHLENSSTGLAVSVWCRITCIDRCLDAFHCSFRGGRMESTCFYIFLAFRWGLENLAVAKIEFEGSCLTPRKQPIHHFIWRQKQCSWSHHNWRHL